MLFASPCSKLRTCDDRIGEKWRHSPRFIGAPAANWATARATTKARGLKGRRIADSSHTLATAAEADRMGAVQAYAAASTDVLSAQGKQRSRLWGRRKTRLRPRRSRFVSVSNATLCSTSPTDPRSTLRVPEAAPTTRRWRRRRPQRKLRPTTLETTPSATRYTRTSPAPARLDGMEMFTWSSPWNDDFPK